MDNEPKFSLFEAIRVIRAVRGIAYLPARDEAIAYFVQQGWRLPTWAENLVRQSSQGAA
jgi:hypothetical protein